MMRTKVCKVLVKILKVLQCMSAIFLIYISLSAVFRVDECDLVLYDAIEIKADSRVGSIFGTPNVEKIYYFKVPEDMVSSENMEEYKKLVALTYTPSSFTDFMKFRVEDYYEILETMALNILVIGLISTGIKILIIKKCGF